MLVLGKEFDDNPMGWMDAAEMRDEARRLVPWWSRVAHWFGRCLRCKTHSTDEGIGGRCVDCGKLHGWMTRDELRRLSVKRY